MNKPYYPIISLFLVTALWAQMPGPGGPLPQSRDERQDRMEMMAMWRLTDELQLTTEQGARFFPDFREYRQTLKSLEEEKRNLAKEVRTLARENDDLSDKELQSILDQWFGLAQRQMTIEKDFITGTGDYLTNIQQLKLAMARERFKNELRAQMKNRKYRPNPPDYPDRPENRKHNPF